jgi:PKD repeat protein
MSINILKTAVVLIIFSTFSAKAQEIEFRKCGTSEVVQEALEQHPELIENLRQLDRETKEFLTGDKALDSTITIPVVFHVFHTYGAERISEAQMRDCIRIMNEDFQNRNADSNQVSSSFRNLVGRPQIRFRLAQKSPAGKCSKGVNYIKSTLHPNGGENLKSVIVWDTKRYLNIWVCSNIANGAAAYAYYPGTAPSQNNEGIVSRANYVGSIGTSSAGYNARTLTHEIGHYFNLAHTWGNSNTPGLSTNCNEDDGVQDTPNCVGVTGSGCNLSLVSCGNLNNVENHMEYSSCRRMFTKGQVTRVHAAINSNIGFRRNLWQASNLVFTGATNDGPGDECPPTPDFKSSLDRVCIGQPVTFTQLAYNVNNPNLIQFLWSFEGGTPATSTEKNPVVIYNQSGNFKVKLLVSNAAGSDSIIQNSYMSVISNSIGYQAGELEGIENTGFPANQAEPLKTWEIEGVSPNTTWRRTTSAAASGSASLLISNNTNTTGNVSTLYSPGFEIVGPVPGSRLSFKYAFQRRQTSNNDRLTVSYSTNCGISWSNAFNKVGAPLATVSTTSNSSFFPTSTDWKQENVSLAFLGSNTKFQLRFQFTGGGGNNIYLDDIQLTTVTNVNNLQDESLSLEILPNPSSGLPKIAINVINPSMSRIEIMDVLGKNLVFEKSILLEEGQNQIDLSREILKPRPGNYWVRLVMKDRVMVRQWIALP